MNILTYLESQGIRARRVSANNGGEYHSPCPACGGADRFHVWPEQNSGEGSWWCRACDKGGDTIALIMHVEGVDFRAAASRCGRTLERRAASAPALPAQRTTQIEPRQTTSPSTAWQQQAAELVRRAARQLGNSPEQLAYLASRGISPQTAAAWQLGYISANDKDRAIYASRAKWGLPAKEGAHRSDALWIPRGLLIPNILPDGTLDSLRIRRPDADRKAFRPELSYHVMPGSGTAPTRSTSGHPIIIVVEAQLDAILLHQHCGHFADVIALGNSSARPDGPTHAVIQQANIILLCLDNDDAGRLAAAKWASWYDHTRPAAVPQGKDPGEAHQHGLDLCQHIINSLPEPLRPTKAEKPRHSGSQAPEPPQKKQPEQCCVIKSKSGVLFGLVTDPADRAAYAAQTGLNVLVRADIERLANMSEADRNQWLYDNDPRHASLGNVPPEHRPITLRAADLFGRLDATTPIV